MPKILNLKFNSNLVGFETLFIYERDQSSSGNAFFDSLVKSVLTMKLFSSTMHVTVCTRACNLTNVPAKRAYSHKGNKTFL